MSIGSRSIVFACLPICALVGFVGCSDKAPSTEGDAPAVEASAPVEVGPEVEAVLARADAVDGTEDHVVSRCPGCALAMEGKAEQAMQVGDYELHFCSDDCREGFEENTAEALLAMKLPEPDPSE